MPDAVPLQSPVQWLNTYPLAGFALSPRPSAAGMVTEHCVAPLPQLSPAPWIVPPVGGVIVIV